MAGNFWESSHCAQWVLDRTDVAKERAADMQVSQKPLPVVCFVKKRGLYLLLKMNFCAMILDFYNVLIIILIDQMK